MPIIDPKTNLRNLSYKEFGTIGDPLVVKDIPGVNQDGPSKGVLKQVTARTDDALRMTRLLLLPGGKRNPAGNKFTANLALLNQQESIEKAKKETDFINFLEHSFSRRSHCSTSSCTISGKLF